MATFNPRKFTDPDWLSKISPPLLIRFLDPWRSYLAGRDFELPPIGTASVNYAALAQVLITADPGTPTDMIDALYYVQETSTAEDMEALQIRVEGSGLEIDNDPLATPADYSIRIWQVNSNLVQERHAEAFAYRQQRFNYFSGRRGRKRKFPHISEETKLKIEKTLDVWFAANKRGQGCRLFVFRHSPHVWLLVRHGRLMSREASHGDDGTAGIEFYRPQQHAVLVYDEDADEIGVHSDTKGECDLYLSTFGGILFGDESYFPEAKKFTLAPLVEDGATALNCADIDGIDDVKLIEYRHYWGGKHKESEVRRATDIFAALEQRRAGLLTRGPPSAAVFKVKFSDSRKERRVVIRPPASARYERNEDSETVEHWLRERGFMVRPALEGDDDATGAAVLEGTG